MCIKNVGLSKHNLLNYIATNQDICLRTTHDQQYCQLGHH